MESWAKAADSAAHVLAGLGPYGTVIVSIVVGLAIVVVLIAHFGGLYSERRAGAQSLDFVDRLIGQVNSLSNREIALRADLERRSREDEQRLLSYVALQADVDLMRVQLRRAIETLRAVREGRIQPSEIADADLAEALK